MIEIPTLNPFFFPNSTEDMEVVGCFRADYMQKWQQGDSTMFQVLSADNVTISVHIEDSLGMIKTGNVVPVLPTSPLPFENEALSWAIEYRINFRGLEGVYYLVVSNNDVKTYSRPFCVQESHPETRLISYRNSRTRQNVYFDSGIFFTLRVESQYPYLAYNPQSEDSIFKNTHTSYELIDSMPYSSYMLQFGARTGIPDYVMKTLNQIFGCDFVFFEGKVVCKTEGSTWEAVTSENYNLRSWTIEAVPPDDGYIVSDRSILINGMPVYNIRLERISDGEVIMVSQNGEIEIAGKPEWLSIEQLAISGNVVSYRVNPTDNGGDERSASVFFRNTTTGEYATLSVVQEAGIGSILINGGQEYTLNFEAIDEGVEVLIYSIGAFVYAPIPLVSVSRGTQDGNTTRVLITPRNNTGDSRSGVVRFQNTITYETVYLYVNQSGDDILTNDAGVPLTNDVGESLTI